MTTRRYDRPSRCMECNGRHIDDHYLDCIDGTVYLWQCLDCGAVIERHGPKRYRISGYKPVVLPRGMREVRNVK